MSPTSRNALALAIVCAALAAAPAARGQSPQQKADAQTAFDKAIELMKQGEIEKACAALEDSQRLDPAMGTQYQLAQCYEQSGRLASAWASYVAVADAAKAAGMHDREHWARERSAALEPQLSRLTIVVPAPVAALAGLSVERDGGAVPSTLWGEAVPVDGGPHQIVARAAGRSPWTGQVALARDRGTARLEVPMLPPVGQTADASARGPARPQAPPATPAVQTGDDGTAQIAAGIVVAGVGLAAMVAGVAVGLVAKSSYDDSGDQHCAGGFCDQEGIDAGNDARARGNVATGLFIGGSAALVAGVVTWLTAPSGGEHGDAPTAAQLPPPRFALTGGPGQAGLGLRARW